jgi:putative Mn2+ efflux pump MntP
MDWIVVFFIAVGLAMDAFAVSISCGISSIKYRIRDAVIISLFFGIFQAIMPVFGWFGGRVLSGIIVSIDHWIAFGLLGFIGFKMIYDTRKPSENKNFDLTLNVLFGLSIATSIDAFIVGLSFAFLKISIFFPVIIIGCITFLLSFIGVFLGCHAGRLFGKKVELLGGFILIGIGLKIFLEHLFNL